MEQSRNPAPWLATLACAFMLMCAFWAGTARATSYSTDASDLWWNPAESGWGIQFVQQDRTIFATMYVYAPSGQPEFYVAVLNPTATALTWSGSVYRTTGPWWGGVFNPALVNEVEVGTMAFLMQTVSAGRLDYTIGGVRVIKDVERMGFVNDRIDGTFLGGARHQVVSGPCPATPTVPANLSIVHGGDTTVSASLITESSSCTMPNGTYSQRGKFGLVNGNYSCTNGETGTAMLYEVIVSYATISLRYRLSGSGPGYACTLEGDFAGVRQ